jgi:Na+/H+ antiporter NhaD/arsenite permease-like protein
LIQTNPKESAMNARTEGTIAIVVALFVLLSAMWDPRISVAVSVVALVALGAYQFLEKSRS